MTNGTVSTVAAEQRPSMTNGTVSSVSGAGSVTLKVHYPGADKELVVPADSRVVRLTPVDGSAFKSGLPGHTDDVQKPTMVWCRPACLCILMRIRRRPDRSLRFSLIAKNITHLQNLIRRRAGPVLFPEAFIVSS